MLTVYQEDYVQDIMQRGQNQTIVLMVEGKRSLKDRQENTGEDHQICYLSMSVGKKVQREVNGLKHIYGMPKDIIW